LKKLSDPAAQETHGQQVMQRVMRRCHIFSEQQ
jgi:hypothetical protein